MINGEMGARKSFALLQSLRAMTSGFPKVETLGAWFEADVARWVVGILSAADEVVEIHTIVKSGDTIDEVKDKMLLIFCDYISSAEELIEASWDQMITPEPLTEEGLPWEM